MTVSITTLCHNAEYHFLFKIMLNVIMLNAIMLSVVMLNVVAPLLYSQMLYLAKNVELDEHSNLLFPESELRISEAVFLVMCDPPENEL
jgi:hypothetical protein